MEQTVDQAISGDDIVQARGLARETGRSVMSVLVGADASPNDDWLRSLARLLRLSFMDMANLRDGMPAFELMAYADCLHREIVLFRDPVVGLILVVWDPFDRRLQDWADERLSESYTLAVAGRESIAACLAKHEERLRAVDSLLTQPVSAVRDSSLEDLSIRSINEDTSPIVRLVNSTLYDAFKTGASDIHLETTVSGIAIKYRVDGVLTDAGSVAGRELAEQVISRIKVMAELDIAERRVPQDGRFKVAAKGREIDLRVSIMPSIHGEDAVLRVLDKQHLADQVSGLRLDSLGFDAQDLIGIRRLASEAYGMLLVTGPTGSGKTTTLYAALGEIHKGKDKIITIEDPVEYQLNGILQIPVNEKKGLTFARGLRSILRHDPDKIMVGEIRDGDTAQIAIQAALTGHLVFTTVHANSVFDVIGRFMHMGVDPYNFVSALNGVVAQRLLRINCPHCSEPEQLSAEELEASAITDTSGFNFRIGRGCGQCRGTGYRGRRAVAELLVLDDELRELITTRAPVRQIKSVAQSKGTRTLREAGLELVRHGETNLAELNRVTLVE